MNNSIVGGCQARKLQLDASFGQTKLYRNKSKAVNGRIHNNVGYNTLVFGERREPSP